jgi:hypothetical protein
MNNYKKNRKSIEIPIRQLAAGKNAVQLQDNRPRTVMQQKINESSIQKKANNTGLPDNLKSGIEDLSGHSMDDVKVHYNSNNPAQLQALAYAQGANIHIAPGQEKHLPHEAWHVVQQKQGRVRPTLQMKTGVNVNDDKVLEREADVMGEKAIKLPPVSEQHQNIEPANNVLGNASIQMNKDDEVSTASSGISALGNGLFNMGSSLFSAVKENPVVAGIGLAVGLLAIYTGKKMYDQHSLQKKEKEEMVKKLLDNDNVPKSIKDKIINKSPDEALKTLGKSLGNVEKWLLLNENVGDNEDGKRIEVMDEIAQILLPFRARVKELIPEARIKYRGSLVRGLKGYPKKGKTIDLKAYDCDAFIEVPSEFWLEMRDKGRAKGIEKDEQGKPTGKTIDIRGYEPLKDITFKKVNDPVALNFRKILDALIEIEGEAKEAIKSAKESGKIKGYKSTETGEIDFEFYIRADYNSTATYRTGNPYLKGQVAERGYPALEKKLGIKPVPEFEKKKENPDKKDLLLNYVNTHGAVGVIMPEYQAVIGKHGWYLEDEILMEWRLLKRQLDLEVGKTKYSRLQHPKYTTKTKLPAFNRPYKFHHAEESKEGEIKTGGHNKLFDDITKKEIAKFSIDLKNLDALMSSIKIFDADTKILSLKDPEKVPEIREKLKELEVVHINLSQKYPELFNTSKLGKTWHTLLERITKKLVEAEELKAAGGSKKIKRIHKKKDKGGMEDQL